MSAPLDARGPTRKTAAQRRTERGAGSGGAPFGTPMPAFAFHPPPLGFRARARSTLRRGAAGADAGTLSPRSGRND